MNEAEAEEPIAFPSKESKSESKEYNKADKEAATGSSSAALTAKKRRSKLSKSQPSASGPPVLEPQVDLNNKPEEDDDGGRRPSGGSESPSDYTVDYGALTPNITMECGSDIEVTASKQQQQMFLKKNVPPLQLKKNSGAKPTKASAAVRRLGANSSISVRQLFPGEEDLPLQGAVDFNTVKERTPEGWEKCNCTIQYDLNTKHLWHELQKPYGNQSSFLRHLILLEKYFRNGDLVLSPNASHHAINYSESVQNRLRAYDNVSVNRQHQQQISVMPLLNPVKRSSSGIVTTNKDTAAPPPKFATMINAANIPKNTPITLSQISSLTPVAGIKAKPSSVPPGLISIQPSGGKAPVVKMSQKIKFPLGKNWKPTLRPVDQSGGPEKKRISGLVQVIAGGTPYHISLEDYNRMCSIQRNKKQAEAKAGASPNSTSSTSSGSSSSSQQQHNSLLKSNLLSGSTTTTTVKKKQLSVTSKTLANLNLKAVTEEAEGKSDGGKATGDKSGPMILPKIPKSLTVIPQTVSRRASRPSSPVLSITTKPKALAAVPAAPATAAAGKS